MKLKITFGEIWTELIGDKSSIRSQLLAELAEGFYEAKVGKRNTHDEMYFENCKIENLSLLVDEILTREYEPSAGIAFTVERPVKREIFAAPFRDRVVHHVIFNAVNPYWESKFIRDCYSCRKGKGTLDGIKRMAKHMKRVSKNYSVNTYVIKLDIKGYFMSLPKEGLWRIAAQGLLEQFPRRGPKYDIYKFIWRKIIFDDPIEDVEVRGGKNSWKGLPDEKSLFKQPPGKGIVIGNLSSQLLSNMYLYQLDEFIRESLGFKAYGRYVDDFYFLVREEDLADAKRKIGLIRDFLTGLGLKLHPNKIYVQEIHKGVPFLGMVIFPGRIVPGKRIMKEFTKVLREVQWGLKEPEAVIPYLGMLKHVNSQKMIARMFGKFGLDYKYGT